MLIIYKNKKLIYLFVVSRNRSINLNINIIKNIIKMSNSTTNNYNITVLIGSLTAASSLMIAITNTFEKKNFEELAKEPVSSSLNFGLQAAIHAVAIGIVNDFLPKTVALATSGLITGLSTYNLYKLYQKKK